MRDGIHKTLKMNRFCKKLLKLAMREVDRGLATSQAARDAVVVEMNRQIRPSFLQKLQELFNDQTSLLNPLGKHSYASFTNDCSVLEEIIVGHCSLAYEKGVRGNDVLIRAFPKALCDFGENLQRGIINHVRVEGGLGTTSTEAAIKTAFRSVPHEELTAQYLERTPLSTRRRKQEFDVEESIVVLAGV